MSVVSHLVVRGFVCRLGLLLVCKYSYVVEPRPFAFSDPSVGLTVFYGHLSFVQAKCQWLMSHLFDIV